MQGTLVEPNEQAALVDIFSNSCCAWFVGLSTAARDGVVTVGFIDNSGLRREKEAYCKDPRLAPFGTHTSGILPPGVEPVPSRTRQGQYAYLDPLARQQFASPALAWQSYLERHLFKLDDSCGMCGACEDSAVADTSGANTDILASIDANIPVTEPQIEDRSEIATPSDPFSSAAAMRMIEAAVVPEVGPSDASLAAYTATAADAISAMEANCAASTRCTVGTAKEKSAGELASKLLSKGTHDEIIELEPSGRRKPVGSTEALLLEGSAGSVASEETRGVRELTLIPTTGPPGLKDGPLRSDALTGVSLAVQEGSAACHSLAQNGPLSGADASLAGMCLDAALHSPELGVTRAAPVQQRFMWQRFSVGGRVWVWLKGSQSTGTENHLGRVAGVGEDGTYAVELDGGKLLPSVLGEQLRPVANELLSPEGGVHVQPPPPRSRMPELVQLNVTSPVPVTIHKVSSPAQVGVSSLASTTVLSADWYQSSPSMLGVTAKETAFTAVMIWLHGLSGPADEMASFFSSKLGVSQMPWLQLRVSCGTGAYAPSWFDMPALPITEGMELAGLAEATATVHRILKQAEDDGFPTDRIVLGGLGQGAALALQAGLSFERALAGVCALSGWPPAQVLGAVQQPETPVLMCHGSQDSKVPLRVARSGVEALECAGSRSIRFVEYDGLDDCIVQEEFSDVEAFLLAVLSQKPGDMEQPLGMEQMNVEPSTSANPQMLGVAESPQRNLSERSNEVSPNGALGFRSCTYPADALDAAKFQTGCHAGTVGHASPVLLGVCGGSAQVQEIGVDPAMLPRELLAACDRIATAQLSASGCQLPRAMYNGPISLLQEAFMGTHSTGSATVLLAALDNRSKIHGQRRPMIALLSIGDCELLLLRRMESRGHRFGVAHRRPATAGGSQSLARLRRLGDARPEQGDGRDTASEAIETMSTVHCVSAFVGDLVLLGSAGAFGVGEGLNSVVAACDEALPPTSPPGFAAKTTLSSLAQRLSVSAYAGDGMVVIAEVVSLGIDVPPTTQFEKRRAGAGGVAATLMSAWNSLREIGECGLEQPYRNPRLPCG